MTPRETTAAVADADLPSAFGTAASVGVSEDAFDAMMKCLPQGTGDLDALLEQEVATAGRSNSLEVFRRLHSIRALCLRQKAPTNDSNGGACSGDSGKTDVDANIPKVSVPTSATTVAVATNTRSTRQKRGRKAVSRDPSYADTLNTVDGINDKVLKKERRMLSNRESARRSRRRKQELMLDLENQVARLTEENEALKKRIKNLEAQL